MPTISDARPTAADVEGVIQHATRSATKPRRSAALETGEGLRVGLLAHVGMQNLGDEILFASALAYYRQRLPKARITAFTYGVEDTRDRYGLDEVHPVRPTHPRPDDGGEDAGGLVGRIVGRIARRIGWIRRELSFTAESAKRLRGVDFVIVPGSSQFIDAYGGPWGFPYALLRWTLIARLVRVPICFLSLGAEKLHHPLSRWMVRRTVALAHYITLRDAVSRERLAAQGVGRSIELVPDLAIGYPAPDWVDAGPARGTGRVGINPIPYFHPVFWRAIDEERYARYLEAMTAMTAAILDRGHDVVLYATTQWADRVPAQDIADRLSERYGSGILSRIGLPPVDTLEDLWEVLRGVDWVVASRYHGVATALLTGRPVVGIAYEQKTADLMGTLGLREYSIPIDDITGPRLEALLASVWENDAEIRERLAAAAEEGRRAVHEQYEKVLNTYAGTPRSR